MKVDRRQFIKYGAQGLAAIVVGSKMPWILEDPAYAAVQTQTLNFRITDAMKEMVTSNAINPAQNYFWIYKSNIPDLPADCPGPIIFATAGETITLTVRNDLDAPHAFAIPRLNITTESIAPGATRTIRFRVNTTGTFLYYDNLNQPVNRMMGLHGAFIVMPRHLVGTPSRRVTPYTSPPSNIQRLFNDLGGSPWWPGLAWEQGDPATDTPAFRQYIWLLHEASPRLFESVGNNDIITFTTTSGEVVSGRARNPVVFTKAFLHDRLDPDNPVGPDGRPANNIAQFFTVSGQSGHFSHNNPYITPFLRVGEPCVIRVLNAGLWVHSLHLHANHMFVLSHNNRFDPFPGSNDNPIWADVFTANPLDTFDWLVPFHRPPDVPNDLGIGLANLETPLPVIPDPIPDYGTDGGPTPPGVTTWPPEQELDFHIPRVGERMALNQEGEPIDLGVHMSPLCYPMHDHSEPTQTSQGGNYNMGMIAGMNITGDRNGAGPGGAGVIDFPMIPPEHGPDFRDGTVPPTVPFVSPGLP